MFSNAHNFFHNVFPTSKFTNIHRKSSRIQLYYQLLAIVFHSFSMSASLGVTFSAQHTKHLPFVVTIFTSLLRLLSPQIVEERDWKRITCAHCFSNKVQIHSRCTGSMNFGHTHRICMHKESLAVGSASCFCHIQWLIVWDFCREVKVNEHVSFYAGE